MDIITKSLNQDGQIGPNNILNNNNKEEDKINIFGHLKDNNENNNLLKIHYSDTLNKEFNLQNQPNDIKGDNNPKNPYRK